MLWDLYIPPSKKRRAANRVWTRQIPFQVSPFRKLMVFVLVFPFGALLVRGKVGVGLIGQRGIST